ncbi:RNA polymerase factor sigma-54, partial [Achromatium sp. WMS1]
AVKHLVQYVTPDVIVSKRFGTWHVELNPEIIPRLRINPDYAKLVRRADRSTDNVCLKNHLQEARWFIKNLTNRNSTLLKVATKIVELQHDFFNFGLEAMRPMALRDIADALSIHESTVSRATNQKYLQCPRGTFELKFFFPSYVNTNDGGQCSAISIQALIKKLIAAEPPESPLSDKMLAKSLFNKGIRVARRTVAKYRESMGIQPSKARKRLL